MKPFIHYFAIISFEYFAANVQNCKMQKYQNIKCHYCQMIKCRIIQYKRNTFQLGLQARNINKSEKNHKNGSYCIVHLKTG